MDLGKLISESIGDMRCWQVWFIFIVGLSKIPIAWFQLLVILVSPRPGEFNCTNATFDKCDPDCPSIKFDHSVWEKTIIHEWNLVCSREYIASMVQGIVMAGILLGSVSFGYLSDRFGRILPFLAAIILQLVGGVAAAFVPWLWAYTLIRFLATIGTGGSMPISFVILIEYMGKYRTCLGILYQVPFFLGHAILGLIGYSFRRWDHIQLVVSVPTALLLSYWWLLPESPRWLLTMGKTEQVIKQFEKIAKCNRMPTENIRAQVEEYAKKITVVEQKEGGNIVNLFRTKRMRVKTLCLFLNWFTTAMSYYAIAQYVGQFGGNMFWNVGVFGLIQVPGCVASFFIIEKFGRKCGMVTTYVVCFVPMVIIPFLPNDPYWPTLMMGCTSQMGAAMSFSVIYVYTGELYPTVIRTVGVGLCSMVARVGSMISPFIMHFREIGEWCPPLVLSIFPIITSVATLIFLPDTFNVPLPDTVEEADSL